MANREVLALGSSAGGFEALRSLAGEFRAGIVTPPWPPAGFACPVPRIAALLLQWLRGESDVASGTVKWFNGQKGYGFIAPDGGGKDVFVHISAVEKAGLDGLPDGAKVTFDIVPNRGKESAENLRVK